MVQDDTGLVLVVLLHLRAAEPDPQDIHFLVIRDLHSCLRVEVVGGFLQGDDKRWDVVSEDLPHYAVVDVVVATYEPVPQPDDTEPGSFGVLVAELHRNARTRLSDHFEQSDEREAQYPSPS